MRVVFAGSPDFAATLLRDLITSPYCPVGVLTQPDRPAGRGRKLTPSAVKALATQHDIEVRSPTSLKTDAGLESLADFSPDVLVVVAYGLILPPSVLQLPPLGCINVHASLLPRWRGAAPIERAYIAGDPVTGVSIMQMDSGLDTGPVYRNHEVAITNETTIDGLYHEISLAGSNALMAVLTDMVDGVLKPPTPQPEEGATYADKLTAADRVLDWNHGAAQLARQVNALASRMPVRCRLNGKGIQLLAARAEDAQVSNLSAGQITHLSPTGIAVHTQHGLLQITELKMEGRGRMDAQAAVNGYADLFRIGSQLV